jgi:hypothetical protein
MGKNKKKQKKTRKKISKSVPEKFEPLKLKVDLRRDFKHSAEECTIIGLNKTDVPRVSATALKGYLREAIKKYYW